MNYNMDLEDKVKYVIKNKEHIRRFLSGYEKTHEKTKGVMDGYRDTVTQAGMNIHKMDGRERADLDEDINNLLKFISENYKDYKKPTSSKGGKRKTRKSRKGGRRQTRKH